MIILAIIVLVCALICVLSGNKTAQHYPPPAWAACALVGVVAAVTLSILVLTKRL